MMIMAKKPHAEKAKIPIPHLLKEWFEQNPEQSIGPTKLGDELIKIMKKMPKKSENLEIKGLQKQNIVYHLAKLVKNGFVIKHPDGTYQLKPSSKDYRELLKIILDKEKIPRSEFIRIVKEVSMPTEEPEKVLADLVTAAIVEITNDDGVENIRLYTKAFNIFNMCPGCKLPLDEDAVLIESSYSVRYTNEEVADAISVVYHRKCARKALYAEIRGHGKSTSECDYCHLPLRSQDLIDLFEVKDRLFTEVVDVITPFLFDAERRIFDQWPSNEAILSSGFDVSSIENLLRKLERNSGTRLYPDEASLKARTKELVTEILRESTRLDEKISSWRTRLLKEFYGPESRDILSLDELKSFPWPMLDFSRPKDAQHVFSETIEKIAYADNKKYHPECFKKLKNKEAD